MFETQVNLLQNKYNSNVPDDLIYKLVSLENFAVYWNVLSPLAEASTFVSHLEASAKDDVLIDCIAKSSHSAPQLTYILKPITFNANAMINRKPHLDEFSIPVLDLDVSLDDFKIGFNRCQFESLLMLLDSIGRMRLAHPHRKFRPKVPISGHCHAWWNFAFNSVYESEVKRRHREWSWEYMKDHRNRCREYLSAYKEKLRKPKNKNIQGQVIELEKSLNVFNILLVRRQAEREVSSEIKVPKKQEKKGWLGGWGWGGGGDEDDDSADSPVNEIKKELTPEEKEKLYQAIGYGTSETVDFPLDFSAHLLSLTIKSIMFTITDDIKKEQVIEVALNDVITKLSHRPASSGVEMSASVDDLAIVGIQNRPLIREETPEKAFYVEFVSNPVAEEYDIGIYMKTSPLHFIYDSLTINSLIEIFTKPDDISLEQVQMMAEVRLNRFKKMSATGLEYAISQHKDLKIDVNFEPLFIVIPGGNLWNSSCDALIMSLGRVKILSDITSTSSTVRDLSKRESQDTIIALVRERAYESYRLSLTDVQFFLSHSDTWKQDVGFRGQPDLERLETNRLLHPIKMEILFQKCIVSDDPTLPKVKVKAVIPSVLFMASNSQIVKTLTILMGIQFPESKGGVPVKDFPTSDKISIGFSLDEPDISNETFKAISTPGDSIDALEVKAEDLRVTEFTANFEINEIVCDFRAGLSPLLKLMITKFGLSATKRLDCLEADAHLGGILIQAPGVRDEVTNMFETREGEDLLQLKYRMLDEKSPTFDEDYIQQVVIIVTDATSTIDHLAIGNVLAWAENITKKLPQKRLEEVAADLRRSASNLSLSSLAYDFGSDSKRSSSKTEKKKKKSKKKKQKKLQTLKTIDATVQVAKISVNIRNVLSAHINGLNAKVAIFGSSRMAVDLEWKNFSVMNQIRDHRSLVFEEIVSSTSPDNLLKLSLIMFTESEVKDGLSEVDIKVVVMMSELKVIFLNEFIQRLLLFLDNFEAAKQRALEAALTASEYAKNKAVSAYETCTKIGLDISLDAPKIIVPRNWESESCVIIDLGKISITNEFKTRQKAVLDTMSLKLSSTKISIEKFSHINNNLNDILQPISFTISVTRNLTFSQHKSYPEIQVSAKLEGVDLRLSQYDIQLFMNILGENLSAEVERPTSSGGRSQVTESATATRSRGGQLESLPMIGEEDVVVDVHVGADVPKQKVYRRIKFDFSLPDVTLAMFDGEEKIPAQKLAEARMIGFETFGEIFTDDSLTASLNMANITLMDARENLSPTGISTLIYGKGATLESEGEKYITINVTMKDKHELLVDMNMTGFTLVFALDYLLKLSEVFLSGLSGGKIDMSSTSSVKSVTKTDKSIVSSQSEVTSTLPASATGNSDMTVVLKFTMSKVDVVLIESVFNTDCPSIIFNSFMTADVIQKDNKLNVMTKVAGIQLAMTNFKRYQERNGEIDAYILKPCDLDVIGTIDNVNESKRLNVEMSDPVELNISPNTVQVLVSILSSIGSENKDPTLDMSFTKTAASQLLKEQLIQSESDVWFLKSDVCQAREVTEDQTGTESPPVSPSTPICTKDQVVLKIPKVMVVVESGGLASMPMIKLQTSLSGTFTNWNRLDSEVTLEMQYYNDKLIAWEPMVEPIGSRLWSTQLSALLVPDQDLTRVEAVIRSTDRFEITVSKTCLAVLSDLGANFSQAVKKSQKLRSSEDIIEVRNSIGFDIFMIINTNKVKCPGSESTHEAGENLALITVKKNEILYLESLIPQTRKQEDIEFIVRIRMDGQEVDRTVCLKQKSCRLYQLPVTRYPSFRISWLLDVTSPDISKKVVNFATPVEVRNNLERSIDIHHLISKEESTFITSIPPKSNFHLPLDVVFSESSLIFVSPGGEYCLPNQGISWNRPGQKPLVVNCESKDPNLPMIHFEVMASEKKVLNEDTNESTSTVYLLDINPTLVLRNLLPIKISYILDKCSENSLESGHSAQLNRFDPKKPIVEICVPEYMETSWVCRQKIDLEDLDEDDINVWTFRPSVVVVGERQQELYLQLSLSKQSPSSPVVASLFAPFWLVNKTEKKITYKLGDTTLDHDPSFAFPLLFSFKPGKLFKQKLQIAIDGSNWSDGFAIDAVGNPGNVLCKGKDAEKSHYCASVDISLSSFSFTKIVTLTSFYNITNRTDIDIEISDDKKEWYTLGATSKMSFWPKQTKKCELFVKMGNNVSFPLSVKESTSSLIVVGDELFNVLVDVGDSSISIQLSDYDVGSCPVKIYNYTNIPVEYGQKGEPKKVVKPLHFVHFVWDKPNGERFLTWRSQDTEEATLDLLQDAYGNVSIGESEENKLYWVCFMEGRQRTLLITRLSELATNALQAEGFTRPKVSLEISMKGLGISVVNDEKRQELIYLGISGSETLWEVKKNKSRRFKSLTVKNMEALEAAFQREVIRTRIGGPGVNDGERIVTLPHKLKVDFSDLKKIRLLEPIKGELRRISAPGFWASVNLSEHVLQFHSKINRIQIDNQMDGCLFGIIMCPVTPPKSVVQDREPKSFIEVSVVLQKTANLNRFKYLSVLIQEFLVQIDGFFLVALSEFIGKTTEVDELDYEKLITTDMKKISEEEEINDDHEIVLSKSYYDLIHFSPIKVHVSFSLGGISSWQVLGIFDLLMRSAGVTLTEFKDVVFKIDFFERKNMLLDNNELISSATSHYIRQVLKQFYVIVLGLDVIGNPVGLVMGLKQGVGDFFYEPFMGIIEGPEEFAEGLAIGVKSLFSHTVGGAAGALSKITGTLGEGVSALTMDDEFIKKRRMRMNQKPNIAQGGKELARGFWAGISGIIRKPIEGARDGGMEGLFKGIGKGAVGIIAQPVTGVVDFASGSLGALKRAVDINAEAKQQRPPRLFKEDGIIRPYDYHDATGYALLKSLDKGSFMQTDHYLNHAVLKHPANGSKNIQLLITNQRVFYLKESCFFGTWDIEWQETHSEIESVVVDHQQQNVVKFIFKVIETYSILTFK